MLTPDQYIAKAKSALAASYHDRYGMEQVEPYVRAASRRMHTGECTCVECFPPIMAKAVGFLKFAGVRKKRKKSLTN